MTRSYRSLCACLATAAALSLAGQQLYAQATLVTTAPGDSRAPAIVQTPQSRIPTGAFQPGRDFDTTLVSTDYYNFTPLVSAPPNPDIAVGPDDILMVVGSNQIARFPNPNATTPPPGGSLPALSGCGWAPPGGPVAGNTGATCTATQGQYGAPTNQEFLSVWLGTALNTLCPTIPRTPQSCIIGNASVRYDQMQGHFVVLFTVVDAGVTAGAQALTLGPQGSRTANWVLLISRFAALNIPTTGTTEVFSAPQPPGAPGGANAGGVNNSNWIIYTGPATPTNAANAGSAVSGGEKNVTAGGNINSPVPPGIGSLGTALAPDCSAGATAASGPCYIPTDARLGLDNDDIIVTATVFNDNIPLASRGGAVSSVIIVSPGSGYSSAPTVSFVGGGCTTQPTATVGLKPGTVGRIVVTAGGTGYTSAPTVTITGGGGTGATATASIDSTLGVVTAITVTKVGSGYTSTPTVAITGGGGTGATATAVVSASVDPASVAFTGGAGCITAPTVTISGGGGTGASAVAQITPSANTYYGTRVRVYKKASLYGGLGPSAVQTGTTVQLVPGNGVGTLAAGPIVSGASANVSQGDFYDLFATPIPTVGGNVVAVPPFLPTAPWTLVDLTAAAGNGIAGALVYEPVHLRGRALASFSGDANLTGITYLVGSIANATAVPTITPAGCTGGCGILSVQPINYTTSNLGATCLSCLPNSPALVGGIAFLGAVTNVTVPAYIKPLGVSQAIARDGTRGDATDASLFRSVDRLDVGDARPQRAVFREGLIYDARSGLDAPIFDRLFNPNSTSGSTVIYDVINAVQANPNASSPIVPPYLALKTEWQNGNFFAPMFDVPANVITYGSVSPINVLPYFDKLFVATTYPPIPSRGPTDPRGGALPNDPVFSAGAGIYKGVNNCIGQEPGIISNKISFPGLFDFRCGEDAFDTALATVNPFSGLAVNTIQYPTRGGASNDPNDLSLWLVGSYSRGRQFSIPGPGQWGTHITNYALSFPTADPYGNPASFYSDVQPGAQYFSYIQIARQTEIAPGGRTATAFNPGGNVNRAEMAYWVVRAQMDETAITAFLNATGGKTCHFADMPCPDITTSAPPTITTPANSGLWTRYVEVMYRRGYTKGCQSTIDPTLKYCPADFLTRGQMSVFLIRAKMNSVFPTSPSGSNPSDTNLPPGGDLFGLQFAGTNYFTDVPATHPYWWYIQKMRELRITIGTGNGSTYSPDDLLTRGQIAVFLVRAFFV